ncbi:MAG: hypothetical protein J6Y91_01370 [Alphaproteobacteria bacterium]|nr:hypothetical protein [Alphaproteobacteria bacterium]
MSKEKIFALNTPVMEKQVELGLLLQGRCGDLVNLFKQGWRIYPEVLNALVALGYEDYLNDILHTASHNNYPVEEMQHWLELYYEAEWKNVVVSFGLYRIAEIFFSVEECDAAGWLHSSLQKQEENPWETIAQQQGISVVKDAYMALRNSLNMGSSLEEKNKVFEVERFLLSQGEYAFLYKKEAWKTLSSSLEGCKYIAETKYYMNGLAMCLMSYYSTMSAEVRDYCVKKLDNAHLDDNYRPRYEQWRAKYVAD